MPTTKSRPTTKRKVTLAGYLRTGHFGERRSRTGERFSRWRLHSVTVFLFQRGHRVEAPGCPAMVDLDPRDSPNKDQAPWP